MSHGNISEFASSRVAWLGESMGIKWVNGNGRGFISIDCACLNKNKEIVTRFKTCYESGQRCALKSKMEEPKKEVSREIEPRQNTKEHKLRNSLDKDLDLMSFKELVVLREELNKGLLSIMERKMQLLKEELEQSRIQQEEVLQTNQILKKQVEDLQALAPQIYCPEPLDVHFPDMEGDARTSSRESSPETQHNFQNADKQPSLPSSTNPFKPFVFNYCDLFQPAHRASTYSEEPVSVERVRRYMLPSHSITGYQMGFSGTNDAPRSGTSLTL